MAFCSNCGAQIGEGDSSCGKCGAKLVPVIPEPMFCRNCGKELLGTLEICLGCGARPMGNSFCPACGAPTTPLTEICVKCGARAVQAAKKDISPVEK